MYKKYRKWRLFGRPCRRFLGPGFRFGACWNRLGETVRTRKKRGKMGEKWARYGPKRVKESGSPGSVPVEKGRLEAGEARALWGWQRAGKSVDEYEDQIAMGYIETTDPAPLTVLQLHPAVGMCTTVRRTNQQPPLLPASGE